MTETPARDPKARRVRRFDVLAAALGAEDAFDAARLQGDLDAAAMDAGLTPEDFAILVYGFVSALVAVNVKPDRRGVFAAAVAYVGATGDRGTLPEGARPPRAKPAEDCPPNPLTP